MEDKCFTCVVCPRGCSLSVRVSPDGTEVSGHACPKGEVYGRQEAVDPRRSLTTTLRTDNAQRPRLPVRSSADLPLNRLLDAMAELDSVCLRGPLSCGTVVYRNLLGLGVDMMCTDDLPAGDGPSHG